MPGASGHQHAAYDLRELRNALGNGVVAYAPVQGNGDLDDGVHGLVAELFPVDDGLVPLDDAASFHGLDEVGDLRLIQTSLLSDILRREPRVFLQ
jgi:hypothetical protein